MKKSFKWIVISIIATLAGTLFLLIGGITYVVHYKIHEIDISASPDGKYELILQQVGDPDWPFGSTHARVVLKEGNKIIKKYKFDVHNDGANISDNSWIVTWYDHSVMWITYGEEQPDQSYRICYDGTTFSKSLDTHYGVKYESQKKEDAKDSNLVTEEGYSRDEESYLLDEENYPVDEDGYPLDEEWQS